MSKRTFVVVGILAALGAVCLVVVLIATGQIFEDPDKADMDRLFMNAQTLPGPMRPLSGIVVRSESYALEPGFLRYWVRTADGSTLKIVLNESTRIVWPRTTEETAATGDYGETSPPASADEVDGLKIVGRYRTAEIGPHLHQERQVFLVNGRFAQQR